VEHLVQVVHLCEVRRVQLFLFPFFVVQIREDSLSSEVLPLVFLLVVLSVQDSA
jgi:hypothetical protein